MKKSIEQSNTVKLNKKVVFSTLFAAFYLLTSYQVQAQEFYTKFLGNEHKYVNRAMTNDNRLLTIELNAKVNYKSIKNDFITQVTKSNDVGFNVAKQYKGYYLQGGIYAFGGTDKLSIIGEPEYDDYRNFNFNGFGLHFGGGKTFVISDKEDISIGAYSNSYVEYDKSYEEKNVTFLGTTKTIKVIKIDTFKNISLGMSFEYRHKIRNGKWGFQASGDVTRIKNTTFAEYELEKVLFGNMHGTAFIQKGPINVYAQVLLTPYIYKMPLLSLGIGLNLNYKRNNSSGGFLKDFKLF